MGIYNISSNYFQMVKNYYFDVDRVPRNKAFEVEVKLLI